MLVTPSALKNLMTGFSDIYQGAYSASPTFWEKLATKVPSSSKSNTYGWMTKLPRMRQWIGERLIQNLVSKSYVLENLPWELTVEVDRDDIEDDNLGVYRPIIQEMGAQAAKWPDDLLVTLLQAGDSATDGPAFDGKAFFATDHDFNGNTVNNNRTSTALTAANYAAVRQAMMSFKGEDSKPLGVRPNLLVVPPALEDEAKTILESELIINADGTAAGTNVYRNTAELLVLPELAGEDTTWYLLDTTRPIKPFVFQERKAPEFVAKDALNDDTVFFKKKFTYGVDSRGAAGYTLPFLAVRAIA